MTCLFTYKRNYSMPWCWYYNEEIVRLREMNVSTHYTLRPTHFNYVALIQNFKDFSNIVSDQLLDCLDKLMTVTVCDYLYPVWRCSGKMLYCCIHIIVFILFSLFFLFCLHNWFLAKLCSILYLESLSIINSIQFI